MLGHFSHIVYFMVSADLAMGLCDYDIIDNALNLSDHNPITISISSTQFKIILDKNASFTNVIYLMDVPRKFMRVFAGTMLVCHIIIIVLCIVTTTV